MPRRSKSFKNWFKSVAEIAKGEYSRRIASKATKIQDLNKKLETVKKSRGSIFDGYPREEYIDLIGREMRRYQSELATEEKALKNIEARVNQADIMKDQFFKHSQIEDMTITSTDRIKVITKMLKFGKSDIGQYEIILDPKTKEVWVDNLSFESPRYNYPHWAVSSKKPCWGTGSEGWNEGIQTYLKNFEFLLFFDTVIRFLTQSDGRTGAYVDRVLWQKDIVKKKLSGESSGHSGIPNHATIQGISPDTVIFDEVAVEAITEANEAEEEVMRETYYYPEY